MLRLTLRAGLRLKKNEPIEGDCITFDGGEITVGRQPPDKPKDPDPAVTDNPDETPDMGGDS